MTDAPALLVLADSVEARKAGPLALAVILVLCIACYFLFRSMSRHLRRVRENFPAQDASDPSPAGEPAPADRPAQGSAPADRPAQGSAPADRPAGRPSAAGGPDTPPVDSAS